jgi:hypothetical protein
VSLLGVSVALIIEYVRWDFPMVEQYWWMGLLAVHTLSVAAASILFLLLFFNNLFVLEVNRQKAPFLLRNSTPLLFWERLSSVTSLLGDPFYLSRYSFFLFRCGYWSIGYQFQFCGF